MQMPFSEGALRAPENILLGHRLDQGDSFGGYLGPTALGGGLNFQNRQKPRRCPWRRVSGLRMRSASFQR
jgi:hypothetical protein